MTSEGRPRRKHVETVLVQPAEKTLSFNKTTTADEPGPVGYFILLVGLVLSLVAIPFSMTALLISGLFIAVFGVTVMVVTDTV
jgi:uncharacterized membrane protein